MKSIKHVLSVFMGNKMDWLNELNQNQGSNYTPFNLSDEDTRRELLDKFANYYMNADYDETVHELSGICPTPVNCWEKMRNLLTELHDKINILNIVDDVKLIVSCVSIVLNVLYYVDFEHGVFGTPDRCDINTIPIQHTLWGCNEFPAHAQRLIFYIQFVASVLIYVEECNALILK